MLPGHKFGFAERKSIASSSTVKKLSLDNVDKDRVAVSQLTNNAKENAQEQENRKRKADSELQSPSKKALLCNLLNNARRDNNNFHYSVHCNNSEDRKKCIVFSDWCLFIGIEGKLSIEGIVKRTIKFTSFPITKRLTNRKVQCPYKYIYILDGTLVDERNEIPQYVQRKFHDGFPEDWENVYQLWKNYIDSGEKDFFNWPTLITDNDVIAPPSSVPPCTTQLNDKLIKNSSEQYLHDQQSNKHGFKDMNDCKIFSLWRVLINDEGQLIIEGILECGRITRSKAIIRRLTHKKVQSICKTIYILDGTLAAQRNELPDYVRWKFHNGFPVDWKDVFLHWKNYLAKRLKFANEQQLQ